MNRESAKEEIRQRELDFLTPAKKKVHNRLIYICPICENCTEKNSNGIVFDPKANY